MKKNDLVGKTIVFLADGMADEPIAELNGYLAYIYLPSLKVDEIALFVATTFVAQIFIQYTLPLRSILWANWYRELNGGKLYIAVCKRL